MRILLLEDHRELRQLIGDHLARPSFAVDAFTHGHEALSAVEAVRYDAIVLDLGLPDGMDILAILRARTGCRH